LKSTDTDAAIAGVKRAVESGRISRERLDLSVRRLLEAKARAGEPEPDPERVFRVVDRPEHRAVVEEDARQSVHVLREAAGALPLDTKARALVLTVTETDLTLGADLTRALKTRLAAPPATAVLDSRATEAEVSAALAAAAKADVVLLALFVRFQSGKGSIAVPAAARPAHEQPLAAPVPVLAVSF